MKTRRKKTENKIKDHDTKCKRSNRFQAKKVKNNNKHLVNV